MVTPHFYQRIGTTAVVSGLLLVAGCRNTSVNSNSSLSPSQGSFGAPPFFRSYEPPSPPGNGNDVYAPGPAPQPGTPSVLPAPGYSEPEVPPPPSAKKSRWNLVPSVFKNQGNSRQSDVRQSAGRAERVGPTKLSAAEPTSSSMLGDPIEETVPSRIHRTPDRRVVITPRQTPWEKANKTKVESPVLDNEQDDSEFEPKLNGPIKTRYGVVGSAPDSPGTDSFESDSSSTGSTGEMPLLLPPRY